MKLTVRDLEQVRNGLQVLSGRKLKIGPSFYVARQLRMAAENLREVDEKRNELVLKYGEQLKTDAGQEPQWRIAPGMPNWKTYHDELESILSQEVEIPFEPRMVEFFGLDELEPAVLLAIMPLLKGMRTPEEVP